MKKIRIKEIFKKITKRKLWLVLIICLMGASYCIYVDSQIKDSKVGQLKEKLFGEAVEDMDDIGDDSEEMYVDEDGNLYIIKEDGSMELVEDPSEYELEGESQEAVQTEGQADECSDDLAKGIDGNQTENMNSQTFDWKNLYAAVYGNAGSSGGKELSDNIRPANNGETGKEVYDFSLIDGAVSGSNNKKSNGKTETKPIVAVKEPEKTVSVVTVSDKSPAVAEQTEDVPKEIEEKGETEEFVFSEEIAEEVKPVKIIKKEENYYLFIAFEDDAKGKNYQIIYDGQEVDGFTVEKEEIPLTKTDYLNSDFQKELFKIQSIER